MAVTDLEREAWSITRDPIWVNTWPGRDEAWDTVRAIAWYASGDIHKSLWAAARAIGFPWAPYETKEILG